MRSNQGTSYSFTAIVLKVIVCHLADIIYENSVGVND